MACGTAIFLLHLQVSVLNGKMKEVGLERKTGAADRIAVLTSGGNTGFFCSHFLGISLGEHRLPLHDISNRI